MCNLLFLDTLESLVRYLDKCALQKVRMFMGMVDPPLWKLRACLYQSSLQVSHLSWFQYIYLWAQGWLVQRLWIELLLPRAEWRVLRVIAVFRVLVRVYRDDNNSCRCISTVEIQENTRGAALYNTLDINISNVSTIEWCTWRFVF